MEGIKVIVLKIFPEMTTELLEKLQDKLQELGVEEELDLKFLEAQDFSGVLKPIQARKFLKSIQEASDKSNKMKESSTVVPCSEGEVLNTDTNSATAKSSIESSSVPDGKLDETVPCVINRTPVNMVKRSWPTVYSFPKNNLRPDVLQQLNEGVGKNDRRIKKAIISALFDDMMMYGTYPTPDMYVNAAKSVTSVYPFLKDTNPCSNPYDSWKMALSEKFRNERRNMNLDSVVKRKRSSQVGPTLKRPMKNWTTARPTGEDDASINVHKAWLMAESKKTRNLNKEKLGHLMKLTFADRRKMVQNNLTIKEIMGEYPALFEAEQMHAEFSLLMDEDLETKFIKNMKAIFEKIVKWPFSKKEETDMARKAQDLCKDDKESDAVLNAGSWLLPRVLLENPKDLIVEGGRHFIEADALPSHPVIVFSGDLFTTDNFTIMAENVEICHPPTLYSSWLSLIETYYCFNLEYPSKGKRTLEFLQKIALGLEDGKKLSPRVASVHAKLQ